MKKKSDNGDVDDGRSKKKKIKKENCFERKESHDEQRLCFGTRNSQLALIISILYPFNFVSFISQNANM